MAIAVVTVGRFIGRPTHPAKADKNGKMPVFIRSIAGAKLPNDSLVVTGTVAESSGLKIGSTLTISVDKTGEQEFDGKKRNRYAYNVIDSTAGAQLTNKLLDNFGVNSAFAPAENAGGGIGQGNPTNANAVPQGEK
jgi:hypothetical protein